MSDPNMVDFYGRVARIEKSRAKGFGFEAEGTLGRSHYTRPARRRRPFLGPVLFVLICGIGLKGAIYQSVGPASYDMRVEKLQAGQGFDALGGWLMQADPVTVMVADAIWAGLARLR